MIAITVLARRPSSPTLGAFAAVVPLPRRWARAKTWATRSQTGLLDSETLVRMRHMERMNRG